MPDRKARSQSDIQINTAKRFTDVSRTEMHNFFQAEV